ncbi:MAG: glycyl-radical enzyme activating protein [Bacteroidales bacterium]|nr:glycyl-radical enzyme activating protein [Bacteroidales bacterium]
MVTIFDIKRFAVHDGPGIRTTVFLKGCPLRCAWCHNPESQEMEPVTVDITRKVNGKKLAGKRIYGERMELDQLTEKLLRDVPFYEESGGGVTFSGGEPLMQAEGLLKLLEACKMHGLHTCVDTSGYAGWEQFEAILPFTDLFLFDLKHMDPELHVRYTGVENGLIRSNTDKLLEQGAEVIFRIPVIPGINTSDRELSEMIRFLKERAEKMTEVHLLPYHRIASNKYRRLHMKEHLADAIEPDQQMMHQLKEKFRQTGLEVIIGG